MSEFADGGGQDVDGEEQQHAGLPKEEEGEEEDDDATEDDNIGDASGTNDDLGSEGSEGGEDGEGIYIVQT